MDEILLIMVIFAVVVFEVIFAIFFYYLINKGGLLSLMWLQLRGGSLIVKSNPDNTIEFNRYKKAPSSINFETIDKAGRKKQYTIEIPRVKHTLKGTSHPVHICPFNSQENININEKKQSAFTVQQWNEFAISNYEAGWNARGVLQQPKMFDIQTIQLILMVVMVLMLGFNFWLTYNVLGAVGG